MEGSKHGATNHSSKADLVYSKLWHKLAKPSLNIPNNDIRPFEHIFEARNNKWPIG